MTTTDIEQTTELALRQSKELLEEVTNHGITAVEQYRSAGELLQRVKSRQKEVEAERKGILRPFDEARDRIMKLFAPVQKNLVDAERLLKASMLDWQRAEDRRVQEEEAAAREAHRIEQERLAAEADAAAAAGNEQRATVLQEMAEDVQLVTPPPVERAAGTSVRQIWRAEVLDKRRLVQAVLIGQVPLTLLDVNMTALNQMAREQKDRFSVPGTRAVMEESMAVRSS
jgi:hypothetical protein